MSFDTGQHEACFESTDFALSAETDIKPGAKVDLMCQTEEVKIHPPAPSLRPTRGKAGKVQIGTSTRKKRCKYHKKTVPKRMSDA